MLREGGEDSELFEQLLLDEPDQDPATQPASAPGSGELLPDGTTNAAAATGQVRVAGGVGCGPAQADAP